jgi:hypothetical protein
MTRATDGIGEREPADLEDKIGNVGCGIAFTIVVVCAAVAVGYRLLRWGGVIE